MKRLLWLFVLLLTAAGMVVGDSERQHPRQLHLAGCPNARSLDGLPVQGGRLRAGLLWRSGALCNVTVSDAEQLQKKGLRTVIDLRQAQEWASAIGPDSNEIVRHVTHLLYPMDARRAAHQPGWYVAIVQDNPRPLRDVFVALSQRDNYPLLFHCAKGKDRTGIVTYLLLELLGADQEQIEADYLESRYQANYRVELEWLRKLREEIHSRGGAARYLESIGVSPKQLEEIREILLQPDEPTR